MKLRNSILAGLLAAGTLSGAAYTQSSEPADGTRGTPAQPSYIVTARNTYTIISDLARNPMSDRDALGSDLVIAEVDEARVPAISERIHQREQRCGGFFAFGSRAEAEAFIRNDGSAVSASRALLLAYTIDNQTTVNPWLDQPTEPNIRDTITQLSAYKNRYYTSSYGKTSAEWIRTKWAGLANGRPDVTTELFTSCTNCSTQPSVILTVQGNELANEIVVLGAHLDSINGSAGGSNEMTAPGADDDASGIATLTEVIRISLASGWKPRRTVKFMGYAAEEVGLRGSNAIAQSFKSGNKNVVGVLQMDMTNYKSGNVTDMKLITDYSNTDLKNYLVALFDAYLGPRGLTRSTYTCGYGCSDHASWTSAGYPSAMFFEAGDSSGMFSKIHTVNDTLANMSNSAQPSVKFAQLGLAFAGELGKTTSTTPGNQAPVASFSSATNGLTATFTDSSTDADGTIASRSWNFGDGSTSTATNPSHAYAAAGTYSVTLTVTDNLGASNTKTASVTVAGTPPVNVPPVANFSASTNGLTATFTDASTDSDGSIASRSWNFGDGTTSTQTSPSKTYAAAGTYTVTLTVTDNVGASNTKTSSVTVAVPPTDNVLQNGVPKTNVSIASKASASFTLVVPAGATNLKFVTSGGTGDADLYVKFGSTASTTVYDCKSEGSSNAETCTIATAQAGTYHVTVFGYTAVSGLSLTGSFTAGGGGGTVLQNGVPRTGLSGSANTSQTFTLVVPAGATNLKFALSGGSGDADLYVKFGSAPTTSSYDCRPYLSGNNETCNITTAQAGTYYVVVRAYSTYSGASLTGSFTP